MTACSQVRSPKEEMVFELLGQGIPVIELLRAMGINTSKIESNMNRVRSEIESGNKTQANDAELRAAFLEATGGINSDTFKKVDALTSSLGSGIENLCSFNPETCQMDWNSYKHICREAARYHLEGRLQEYLASDRPKAICKKSFPWIAVAGLGALGFGVWFATKK